MTNNSWPYRNTNQHLVIIGKKHKENFKELASRDWSEIDYLVNFAIKKWRIKGGALAMRFGDTDYTGASVAHLHFHIISPKINSENPVVSLNINFLGTENILNAIKAKKLKKLPQKK